MSKKILFFGNERLATGVSTTAPALQALLENGYDVAAVVVAQNPLDKSRQARELEIESIAKQYNLEVISPDNLVEAKNDLKAYNAEAAVLIAYGKIIPQEILDIFPKGIINIHPSLLPAYRGPTPIESAILNNEPITGVSLMRLGSKMDDGPVYAQQKVSLNGSETKQSLADQLSTIGSQLIVENLPRILDGSLQPEVQDESKVTFSSKISKQDGVIDWQKPAEQLEREVRAYLGWPRSRTKLGTADIVITQAHVAEGSGPIGNISIENKQLGVHTADGTLVIDKLIPAGKKEMPAAAFLAGYQLK